jgi:hypothetical protein
VDIEKLQKIETKELKPGDVVVVTTKGPVSEETAERLCEYLKRYFPHQKLLLLDDGTTLDIYRQSGGKIPE